MDELTISGKTYISSKQAAKITGYAKDYVGQLCREGRVDAKLVGRNWYVLEESIREHRFGKEEAAAAPESAPETSESSVTDSWSAPQYRTEEASMLPPIQPRVPAPKAETAQLVSDMQEAWKEWFAADRSPVATLETGADELSEEIGDKSSDIASDYEAISDEPVTRPVHAENVDEGSAAFGTVEDEEEGEAIAIERIPEPLPERQIRQIPGAHDIAPLPRPIESEPEPVVVGMTYDAAPIASRRPTGRQKRAKIATTTGGGKNLIAQAAMLSIAGIIVVFTIVGIGALDTFVATNERAGLAETIINYFQGESTVIKQ
ncbi:MAG TPA: helix-turn-helix domain-containing protein [Candidatus Paceibacterota bacterium]|nr:helix-turn-helix domain-containing protein [Candidatus Paceibacterota bacterium]